MPTTWKRKFAGTCANMWKCTVPEKVLPKGHYALHLADSLRHHEILLSCFVHERRHRSVRQIADQLDSMKAGSEEHVMQVAVENHLNDLRAYTVGRKGLVTPRSAAAVLQEAFCHCLWFGRMCWLGKLQRSGRGTGSHLQARRCSGGRYRRYTHCGTGVASCVLLRPWLYMPFFVDELGEYNVFRMDSSRPIFVPTQDISSLCIHRPEGDNALVIPLKGPLWGIPLADGSAGAHASRTCRAAHVCNRQVVSFPSSAHVPASRRLCARLL